MIEESQFNALADATLARLETALEDCGADLDYELGAGGVLEIEFPNRTKIIVNRHTAAREIWVAAKSGGFHYRPEGDRWLGTRDGEELFAALSRLISEQGGEAVSL
jgi:CyaY protein